MPGTVYFIYDKLQFGGAQTLMVRMARWLLTSGYSVLLCCEKCEADFAYFLEEQGIPVQTGVGSQLRLLSRKAVPDDLVFVFSIQRFLQAKLRCKSKCCVVLYMIHPEMMDLRRLRNHPSLQKAAKLAMRPLIRSELNQHRIILMDQVCLEHIRSQFCLERIGEESIFPLPYEDGPMFRKDIEKNVEKRRVGRRILAIARADFPFKGYLLGLIERFPEICETVGDCFLDIISHGPGEERLREAITKLPLQYQERVLFHGGKNYDELIPFYQNAEVYIGMGSTLIEAARCGLPAIDAKPYTEKLALNPATFAEDPMFLGTTDETYAYAEKLTILYEVLQMDEVDYQALCLQTFDQFQKCYSIDSIMERMLVYFRMSEGKESRQSEVI